MKNKMIRPYADSDLLEIALEKLNQLDYFDHRFLAVSENELAEKARKYNNIKILHRNPEAVTPGPHDPTITFEHYTRIPTEYFFVINPCAAFLSLTTIKQAFDIFQNTNFRSYIAVEKTRDWVFDQQGRPLTRKDPNGPQNTSDGEHFLRATHAFYIANRDFFKNNNGKLWTLEKDDPHLIEMPAGEAIDIDTDLQFEVSEYLYMKKVKK